MPFDYDGPGMKLRAGFEIGSGILMLIAMIGLGFWLQPFWTSCIFGAVAVGFAIRWVWKRHQRRLFQQIADDRTPDDRLL